MSTVLGALDRDLLAHLARDGRASYQELGRAIGLSPTATADRCAGSASSA
ncbi:MAG: AsnC family protein [Acidimicrobiales bacterium]